MTTNDIINRLVEIDERLDEIKVEYEPYVGREFSTLTDEEVERVRNYLFLIQGLLNARAELRHKAIYENKIFVL